VAQPTAAWLRDRFGAVVQWLPFDLHPEYPPTGLPREQLIARYGVPFHDRLRQTFAAAGLDYNPHPTIVPNTRDALRVSELARDRGLHEPFHDLLMDAYWRDARDIGDRGELRALAAEARLATDDVEAVLSSDAYAGRVAASTREAHRIGANAVPAFLLDRRLLVLGAQPRQVFEQAFAQLR
jgi:predicted DsbA family dithiol-disulfide isomerase